LRQVPPERYPSFWRDLLAAPDGRLLGAWVKAAHKSLLWYRPDRLGRPPATWAELLAVVRARAGAPGPAPLAVGAADGWVLTDWLENLVAALTSASEDERLAADLADGGTWDTPAVVAALTLLAELWSVPGALAGGGRRALLTQFDESIIQVAAEPPRALMAVEGDFAASVVRDFPRVAAVPFPVPTDRRPVLVGGDAAVVLAGATDGAHDLVEWLTRPDSFGPWLRPAEYGFRAARGGYLSPLSAVTPAAYGDEFARRRAAELTSLDNLRFDLTDRLSGFAGGGDGVGSWKVLQDFLAEVTTPGVDRAAAVVRAVAALDGGGR
jgi:ABC-type glycerol-3-phosphate transport system substrate-binding protein